MRRSKYSNSRVITISPSVKGRYLKRDGKVECIHCGKTLTVGVKAFSRRSGGAYSYKKLLYCMECADTLNLI